MKTQEQIRDLAIDAAAAIARQCNTWPQYASKGWLTWPMQICPLSKRQYARYTPSARITVAPNGTLLFLSPHWEGNGLPALVELLLKRGCALPEYAKWLKSTQPEFDDEDDVVQPASANRITAASRVS
jgi:hypothetical protein